MIRQIHHFLAKHYQLVIPLLVFTGIEAYYSYGLFIWLDEAFTLNTTDGSLWKSIKIAIIFEGQPPFYFAFLNLFRKVDDSIAIARLFSILNIAFSATVIYLIGSKHLRLRFPFLVVLIFVLNPMVMWAGLEIRVYSMIVLFSSLIIYVFHETYLNTDIENTRTRRVAYSIIGLIAVCTQYYLALLLISNFLFLISSGKRKISKLYLMDMILPVSGFLIFIPFLKGQLTGHTAVHESVNFFPDGVFYMADRAKEFIFPVPRLLKINNWWLYLVLGSGFLIAIRNIFRTKFLQLFSYRNYYLLNVLFLLLLFSFLFVLVGKYNVSRRHIISLIVPLLLLTMQFINLLPKRVIQFLYVSVILLTYFFTTAYKIENSKRRPELITINEYIGENQDNDLPVLVYRGEISLIYEFANNTECIVVPIPGPINMTVPYDHCRWFIKDSMQLETFFNDHPEFQSLWLISSENDKTDKGIKPRVNCPINYEILTAYISKNYHSEEDTMFGDKLILRKLKLKSSSIKETTQ